VIVLGRVFGKLYRGCIANCIAPLST